MGLKASRLFSESFRASHNPKAVIHAFMYARHDFMKIYLESGIRCDRLVFDVVKEARSSYGEREDRIRNFVFWAIWYAEKMKVSWDDMFERLTNAFTLEELHVAVEANIESYGLINEEKSAWNPEGAVHFRERLSRFETWNETPDKDDRRDSEVEQAIREIALAQLRGMKFKDAFKGMAI